MLLEIIGVLIGLFGLWFGSDIMLRAGKNLARHYGISYFFFGLAFVSIGTSIPEIAVSISGAISNLLGTESSGLVIGNKVGSAVALNFIMGLIAVFAVLQLKKRHIFRQGGMLLGSIILFFSLAFDGTLSRLDGAIFIGAYIIYYILLYKTEKISVSGKTPEINLAKEIIYMVGGLGFVLISSRLVVSNGVSLAELIGVSQSLIGVLIVGLGTGLPELAIGISSIKRKVVMISMGNLIGSNICNLLLATGLGALISRFIVDTSILIYDLPILFIFSLLFIGFILSKKGLDRIEGLILMGLYVIYIIIRILIFK